jgi:hypothetical protein
LNKERALQNRRRIQPVHILKGSLKGGNDKQYTLQGERLRGELSSLAPVDDVMIKENYVQFGDIL